jgi:hypothetical protein
MNWPHPGTARTVCTCRQCRRDIRLAIERAFVQEPRWMGEFTIRERAWLGWVPLLLFRHILGRMVLLGIMVKSNGPGDEFPRYILARCMVAARSVARQGGGL